MTETKKRLAVRVLSWRAGGILLGVFIAWFFTGDWLSGLEIGLSYNVIRLVTHYIHEHFWARLVEWGFST